MKIFLSILFIMVNIIKKDIGNKRVRVVLPIISNKKR